ncbi:IS3 family transposase [Paenibacillus alginolyticus]|uniref:IS3 family transposase n=1 Tax=Paenibacillus alginolyticus TaxID=59839 RepID=UPI001FE5CCB0|nr:IS3 family transposase [Paenibacillus frigoriresistens]
MSKKIFSEKDQMSLSKNKYVIRISDKAITYADEFKQLFIDQYMAGRLPREIFEANGFDVNVIGIQRVKESAKRWRKAYGKDGIIGLADSRKEASGRPLKRELTKDEVIERQEARIRLLESQLDLLKKLDTKERLLVAKGKNLSKSKLFELIKETVGQGLGRTTRYLCNLLHVSRSGYYNYIQAVEARKEWSLSDAKAGELIKKAFHRKGFKKGSRSIKMTLENEFGVIYNLKRIRRLMKKFDLVCPHRKPNPYKRMAKATQEHRTLPNSLDRDFRKGVPGLALLTDITYLPYGRSETAYLSTILDASTGEILAYNLSNSLTLDIATDTIEALMKQRKLKLHKKAFIHSDQGSHYTSPTYQKLLKQKGLGQSMSRRGNCWDNAPQESFYGHMKDHVDHRSCPTLAELQRKIDSYIRYYNNNRYQWGLKKMTPVQYEATEKLAVFRIVQK